MAIFSICTVKKPAISILGAGALGSIYGAYLAEAGYAVSLISRNAGYVQAVRERGLLIRQGKAGARYFTNLSVVRHLREAPPPDAVFFLVKSQDSAYALQESAAFIPPACTVLSLQNGLGNLECLSKYLPPEQILTGVSYMGSALTGPGEILLSSAGLTLLGERSGQKSPRTARLAEILQHSGLEAQVSDNIQGQIWTKVLVNAAINPLAALTRLHNGQIAEAPESLELIRALIAEGVALAHALGIRLEVDDPVAHTLAVAQKTAANRASMLQDILRGRKTEISAINGAIAEKSAELGLNAPCNKAVSSLIAMLERSF